MNRKLLAAIAVLGVLSAGCELRADLRLELEPDQSGRLLVTIGLDEEFQALIESSGEEIEDSFFGEDSPFGEIPGGEQRTYTEGEFTYYEASAPFANLDELRRLDDGDGDDLTDSFDITYTDDSARVTGTIDLGEVTGGDLADDQLAGISAEAFAQIFKIKVQVKMPGDVTRHNADRVLDDGALEWDIPLTGEVSALDIEAESSLTESGGFPVWLIAIIVLVVLAAIAFMVMRARPTSSPAAATPDSEQQPAAVTPPVTEVPEVDEPLPPQGDGQ